MSMCHLGVAGAWFVTVCETVQMVTRMSQTDLCCGAAASSLPAPWTTLDTTNSFYQGSLSIYTTVAGLS